jgi:opacity protein-like surface antigen
VIGGLKFGRFFDCLPWFGIEGETSLSRNNIRGNQGRISPPPPGGPNNLFAGSDWFIDWTMQLSLMARRGFLKDKEVNFGRLQPYLGIGPGFEVVYFTHDSAKNLAIEAQAGVRYMVTEKIGLFCEYKFSYQFAVEYQDLPAGKQVPATSSWSFDLPHHRFVLGVSYHFKNLYGN